MAQWINLNQNNISVVAHQYSAVRKNWAYIPTASGSYSRLAGWLVNEIRMDFKFLKFSTN